MLKSLGIAFLSLWLCLPLTVSGAAAPPGDASPEVVDAWIVDLERGAVEVNQTLRFGDNLATQGRFPEARRVFEALVRHAPDNAIAHYWLGRVLVTLREFDLGIVQFERSVQLAPDNLRLKMELGKSYEAGGRLEDARAIYEEILARSDEEPVLRDAGRRLALFDARDAFVAGELEQAHAIYRRLLDETPDDPRLIDLTATVLEDLGRHDESDRLFQRMLEQRPDDPGLRMRLGVIHERRGDSARAAGFYADVIRLQPSGELATLALERLGLTRAAELLQTERAGEALAEFDRIIALAPQSPVPLLGRAMALHQLDRHREAESAYREVIALTPDAEIAWLELGQLYQETGRIDDAIAAYEQVEEFAVSAEQFRLTASLLNPLYARKHAELIAALDRGNADIGEVVSLGEKLVLRGFHEDAARLLKLALDDAPDNPQLLRWLGRAEFGLGEVERGLAQLERAAQIAAADMQLRRELAQAYEQVGRLDDAERIWQDILRRSTDDAQRAGAERSAGLLRVRRHEQAGDVGAALDELDRLIERFEDDVFLQIAKGRLLLMAGRDADAEREFAGVLSQAPESIPPYLQVAQLYRAAGRPGEAERVYREALAVSPGHVGARLALGNLHQAGQRYGEAFDEYDLALAAAQGGPQEPAAREALNELWNGLIEEGRRLLNAGSYAEAEATFNILLTRRQDNAQARFWLSEVYRLQRDYARQAGLLAQAAAEADDNLVLKRRLAIAYDNAGMLDEAVATLREVIEAFPFDSEIRARLGDVYSRRGDESAARGEYIRLLELNPTAEWRQRALDRLGLDLARERRERLEFDRAVAMITEILAEAPEDALVYLELGRIQVQAGRVAEAEEAWRNALRLDPGNEEARIGLARIFTTTGRDDEAIAIYSGLATASPPTERSETARTELDALMVRRAREAIAGAEGLEPDAARAALTPTGVRSFELGAHEAAREIFEHLVRRAPDAAEPNYWLGRVFAELDALPDAVIFMRRSTEIEPDNARFRIGLGRVYREMDLDTLAVQAFESAVELDPDNATARFELAASYQRRGDDDRAREQYVRMLERATDQASFSRALAGLGLNDDPDRLGPGQLEAAVRLREQSLTTAPRALQARLYFAIVYHRLQRYDEAEAIYRNVLSADPAQVQAALRLAQLFGETGRIDDGITLYELIATRTGDQRLAALALQQQTGLYIRKAEQLTEALARGEGSTADARRLGPILVERGAHDSAAPMLEAATRRAPRDPQLWYFLGRAHADRGRFDAGIAALERSDQLFPGNLLLRHHLALTYGGSGQVDKAIPIFEELSRQDQDPQIRREARMSLGMLRAARFEEGGNIEAALREFDALLELAPDDVNLLGERGRLLSELGRDDEANVAFRRALEIAPDNLALRLRLAGIHRDSGDNAGFLEQVSAIIERGPRSAESQQARAMLGFNEGLERLTEGEFDQAEEIFERMMAAVPRDPLVRFQLGETYVKQRRFPEAEAHLTEVVRDVPDFQEGHLALARLYEMLERPDSAIRAYERVLELGRNTPAGRDAQPSLAALYGMRVQDLFVEGRDREALAGLIKLLESDPANIAARTTLAALYSQIGRHDEALRELEIAARIQPGNPRIYAQMGAVHTAAERDLRAVEAHAMAIALDTDEDRARQQVRELVMALARHLITQDQPFAAIRHLRALNDHGIGNERSYFMLAALYRQLGRFDEATRAFRDSVRFAPDNVSLRFSLAELYERSNDLDLALIQYQQIVRGGEPGSLIVEEARRRVGNLRVRLALFTSQLSYTTTIGEANIEEQDITGTGALNTNFSSQLFYNLSTNFSPTPSSSLRLDTGLVYISNHSTERDTIVPRIGVSGNLNFPVHFYGASVHASDIRELISDSFQGRSYSANASGGIRFTDFRDLLPGWWRKRRSEHGEAWIERAPEVRVAEDAELVNPRLRHALDEAYRRMSMTRVTAPGSEIEGMRRYEVREGDGLREIAAALSYDPRVWEEEWRDDPRIVDPSLILPGDTVALIVSDGKPMIIIESRGEAGALSTPFELLAPEQRLEREARIRAGVEEGMTLYRSGVAQLRQGRYDAAQSRFEQILAIVPSDPLTLHQLAIANERQGRSAEAERNWRRALEADPSLQAARLGLAEAYLDIRRFEDAVSTLAEYDAHREAGDGVDQAAVLGRRIADAGVAAVIMELPEPRAVDLAWTLRMAGILVDLGDPAAARGVLDDLNEAWPFSPEANHLLARILFDGGQAGEAMPHIDLAVELDPEQARYRLLRGRIHRALGAYEAADVDFGRSIELADDPQLAGQAALESGMNRAEQLRSSGEFDAALSAQAALLDEHPDRADLMISAADTAVQLGRLDDAASYLRQAVVLEPDDFSLRMRLADLYLRQARGELANEALAAALALADGPEERREVLDRLGFENGLDQIRNGRWSRALSAMERIRAVAPDDPLIALNIGVIRQNQGRDLDAEAAFQQLLDEDPRNLSARLRLGLLYSETGRVDRAIALLERVSSEGRGMAVAERAQEALEGLESRRLRRLVDDEPASSTPSMKTLQLRAFYNDTELPARSLTETLTYGVGLSLFYRSLRAGDWILNYTFSTRENEDPLGTDYAFVSNDFGVTWRSSVPNPWNWFGTSENIPGVTGTISLNREMRVYTFADTNALNALGRIARREHNTDTLMLGLNYQPPNHDSISFFLNYNLGRSRTNLPVGIVFSPDGIPIAFQSRGLGNFDPSYVTAGMAFQF